MLTFSLFPPPSFAFQTGWTAPVCKCENVSLITIHQNSFLLAAKPNTESIIEPLMKSCANHLANPCSENSKLTNQKS